MYSYANEQKTCANYPNYAVKHFLFETLEFLPPFNASLRTLAMKVL